MGQCFLYADLLAKEFFEPHSLDTDGKFLCNATNNPGTIFQLLTIVGLQPGGTAEVPAKPVTSISNKKYQELLAEWVGRWVGGAPVQIGEYTRQDAFALLLKEPQRGAFRRCVTRVPGRMPPLTWIREQYRNITPQMVTLAKAIGLVARPPASPFMAAGELEQYLKNRLLYDWQRAAPKATELRWLHPHDLEAYLSTFRTRPDLERTKTMLRGCKLEPVHLRILEHFVAPHPPYYGRMLRCGSRWVYDDAFAHVARQLAYANWEAAPDENVRAPRRLPDPPISTPLPKYHKRQPAADADQLRHLDLSGTAHATDSTDESRSPGPVDGPAAADGTTPRPQRRRPRT